MKRESENKPDASAMTFLEKLVLALALAIAGIALFTAGEVVLVAYLNG
ncbi:hypothetical protein [Roseobacter ponti]|uniref:Uncharacterized protein n=1 Tax=Roseobacter ponti TaxID=1891787 RepID=A0A858SSF1_9RHOB|nr:hypothetical protein [Roseobacter ponti]QJF51839.1 hypothetical protein G3256_12030 [Roseobacter ponti]